MTSRTKLGLPVYFCDKRSPWQRGATENTNRVLRQYLPKNGDLHSASRIPTRLRAGSIPDPERTSSEVHPSETSIPPPDLQSQHRRRFFTGQPIGTLAAAISAAWDCVGDSKASGVSSMNCSGSQRQPSKALTRSLGRTLTRWSSGMAAICGTLGFMPPLRPKDVLHHYLQEGRDALLWKLSGLSEYDIRRPLTPTGTNLLGLVKHVAGCEIGYFGVVFGRPFEESPAWLNNETEPNADMWATTDESREDIVGLYQRAWAHSDETIRVLDLDATGSVNWWRPKSREVTLHRVLIHMIAETRRHVGHADIVREMIDGAVGLYAGNENLPAGDADWWAGHRARVQRAAEDAGPGAGGPA